MSSTETKTATSDQRNLPVLTVLNRVYSIPLVSSSLVVINDTLAANSFTRHPYAHAKGISTTALKAAEPIQVVLAPVIVRVDGIANQAVDVVEAWCPYPFKAQPQDVFSGVKEAIDDKVKTPAINVAQGIDHRLAPIVDRFEQAVSKFNGPDAGQSSQDAKYQYQRAMALTKSLGGSLVVYSHDHLKQFHTRRASETVQAITAAASSSLSSAQTRIHSLSKTTIQKLQSSVSNITDPLQSSFQGSYLQHQVAQVQHAYAGFSAAVSATGHEVTSIITQKDIPFQEKISRVGKEMQSRFTRLLDAVRKSASSVLTRSKDDAAAGTNGNAASNSQ